MDQLSNQGGRPVTLFFFERGLLQVDTSPPQAVLSTNWIIQKVHSQLA